MEDEINTIGTLRTEIRQKIYVETKFATKSKFNKNKKIQKIKAIDFWLPKSSNTLTLEKALLIFNTI